MPTLRLVTVIGDFVAVAVPSVPPSVEEHRAWKLVIGAPLLAGTVKVTWTAPCPNETAWTLPGLPGAPATMPALGAENPPVPDADRAATLKR